MKTRMYDPGIGRFLSKDSSGGGEFALMQNPYLYTENNPVDRVDPDGKSWWSKLKAVASSVVKAVETGFMRACQYVESVIGYVADKVGPALAKIPGMKWGATKVGQYADKYGGSMGSALLGGMLVALTITDIAAGAGLIGLAGKTLAKTIFTRGASRALLNKSIPQLTKSFFQIVKNVLTAEVRVALFKKMTNGRKYISFGLGKVRKELLYYSLERHPLGRLAGFSTNKMKTHINYKLWNMSTNRHIFTSVKRPWIHIK